MVSASSSFLRLILSFRVSASRRACWMRACIASGDTSFGRCESIGGSVVCVCVSEMQGGVRLARVAERSSKRIQAQRRTRPGGGGQEGEERERGWCGWLVGSRLGLGLIDWVMVSGWLEVGSDDERNDDRGGTERRD